MSAPVVWSVDPPQPTHTYEISEHGTSWIKKRWSSYKKYNIGTAKKARKLINLELGRTLITHREFDRNITITHSVNDEITEEFTITFLAIST